ncbi:3-phosphoglycerate dehydrogenase [Candidatus Desantisbacteria bacterium CG_4_10_14_0_8_um_filter_48_22]|uniref:3-phosphoglycerate dehydrogenase n=1 Tax=Candidatus Desantisbacteria bacterium CG_4_10_14_0_8_um_filter_48_22 TaxID=1974543 RepID=A0A2M7SA95_9BACT|nr:MAG: 3-phosphoglycerate dehydrogenase [Candidatus Desantisbacteria bacterium CG02_land_8_20_14_3_00_49_13]PIZ16213.1 MAG: 3-phosphoglycerate dehydrogenase [Candidatus Desantisbacteria bacterium CG_4_10_14_0_8_um_filter_48_22]
MSRPRIAVVIPKPHYEREFCAEARNILNSFADITLNEKELVFGEEEKTDSIKDADGVITGWGDSGLTKKNIEGAQKLRIIGVIGSSVKLVQPEFAMDKGIAVVNTAQAIGDSAAEYALALILVSLKDIILFNQWMKVEKKWVPEDRNGADLSNKTVGIIGLGAIGRKVARLLSGFGARVLAYDPYFPAEKALEIGVEMVALDQLLSRSQVITIHSGMTSETLHLIGEKELNMIQKNALLVNTARADIIDEEALAKKLKEGKFKAAIDVFHQEPLAEDSPLRSLDNVILTPHRAGATEDTYRRIGISIAADFRLFFEGKPPKNALLKEQLSRMT